MRVPSGERPRSALWMPLVVGGKGRGWISLQNLDRDARVQRLRRAAPRHDRRQPRRRARERTACPRDEAAGGRARGDQQRPGVDRRRARPAGDLRPRRRKAACGLRRAGGRHRRPRSRRRPDPLRLPDRARRSVPERDDAGDRLPEARDGDPRAARDPRGHGLGDRRVRQPYGGRRRELERLGDLPAARGRWPGDGRDLDPEPRPRARLRPVGPAAARDDRRQPRRRARERAADPRDETARRRARHGEQRRPGARDPARPRRADPPGRRARPRDVRRGHRLRRPARRGRRRDRVPVQLGAGRAHRRAADAVRRGPDLADHRVGRAAPRGQRRRRRRPAGRRHPLQVLPRRPDLGPRPGDRRDQRPEHARGRALRRGRHAPARDARRQRGRGDPERAPLRRDRSPEGVLRVARRDQPGRRDRDGRGRGGHRLEPGRRRAVRLFAGGGDRAPDRRPRVRRGASPRGPRDHRGGCGERACASNHPAHPQGRHTGRRRADARPARRRGRAHRLPRHLPRHHRAPAGRARRPRRRRRRRARSWRR